MGAIRAGFTTRASCLLAAGATALVCGILLGELDLIRAGTLGLAVPIVAALVVFRSRVRIANLRTVEPGRAAAGSAVTMNLTITNRSLLPTGALLLEDQLPRQLAGHARFVIPGLASREARTVSYRMPALSRGRYRSGPLRIRLTDPFHLVDVVRSFTVTSEFVVAPVVEALPALEPPRSHDIGDNAGSHSVGAYGADDASTREYRTGDDLRKIHWKSSARTGALMVRQEERPWQGQTTLLLDLRAAAHLDEEPASRSREPHDVRLSSSLEWAISAAASIGTHLMLAGRDVGLISELTTPDRRHFDRATRLNDYLADVRSTGQGELTPAASVIRAAARDSALIAVLGNLDAASLRTVAQAHLRGSAAPAFALLLDTLSWQGSAEGHGQCAATARVLNAAGWHVVVVRRGDHLPQVWQSLLRARMGGSSWAPLR
ncbi:MAG: DUF58 domain-containing protein [Actinomycetota bacterium]|nr:DUF58 domain-containing protein [Actinomycetota bacterium]